MMVGDQVLTLEGVKVHAQDMELFAISFLNSDGWPGALGGDVEYVRVVFIDGKLRTMLVEEFKDNFSETLFKVCPARYNS